MTGVIASHELHRLYCFDHGRDADESAFEIDEGAAAVTGVGYDVCLQIAVEGVGVSFGVEASVPGADDAGGDGGGQIEWVADGEHPVADLGRVGVCKLDGREAVFVDVQQREVGEGVGGYYLAAVSPLIGKKDGDAASFIDGMAVGDDIAVGANDHAGCADLADVELGVEGSEEFFEECSSMRERMPGYIAVSYYRVLFNVGHPQAEKADGRHSRG